MVRRAAAIVIVLVPAISVADVTTVFRGWPTMKINVGPAGQSAQKVEAHDSENLACSISKIDGHYYWASRDNKEMSRSASGVYVTFSALDGSGYVRFTDDPEELARTGANYVEHILIMLGSVTYYGKLKK